MGAIFVVEVRSNDFGSLQGSCPAPPQSATLLQPDEADAAGHVEVGVDEDLVEDGELAAEGRERQLRSNDVGDLCGLVVERGLASVRALAVIDVVGGELVARRKGVDAIGQVGGHADGASGSPDADREPVEQVVIELPSDEDGSAILVEECERHRRRELETPFAVKPQMPDGGRTLERPGELNLLARWRGRSTRRCRARTTSPESH